MMSMDLQSNPVHDLLHVSFNQDYSCVACGTESGFKVYNADPFRLTLSRDFSPGGGLGIVAMLFRTNILALAGGGRSPRYQPHKVVLWDDRQARTIAELSFRSAVRSVRLRRDLVVAVLNNKVYVYGFRSLALLDSIETTNNPKGLCCLSTGSDRPVLVCPGMQQGRALVIYYPRAFGEAQAPVARERTTIVAAHESPIAAMALDFAGNLLATASDKGTIVRVYDTAGGTRRQELRRGADRAEIHSLAFSPSGEFLAVSSDKGTIHIFAVGRPSPQSGSHSAGDFGPATLRAMQSMRSGEVERAVSGGGGACGGGNAKSSLQRISRVLPAYFSSEWSLAQFRVPDYRCIAAFGADPHTVVAICANGSYYKARFDPVRGGEMVREEYVQLEEVGEATPMGGCASPALGAASPAAGLSAPGGGSPAAAPAEKAAAAPAGAAVAAVAAAVGAAAAAAIAVAEPGELSEMHERQEAAVLSPLAGGRADEGAASGTADELRPATPAGEDVEAAPLAALAGDGADDGEALGAPMEFLPPARAGVEAEVPGSAVERGEPEDEEAEGEGGGGDGGPLGEVAEASAGTGEA